MLNEQRNKLCTLCPAVNKTYKKGTLMKKVSITVGKVAALQSCDLLLLAALLFEADQLKYTVPSATL